ncbi:MAG: dTMP kinase [Pirellulales bacterium]|nr:dTMP kinase [Pirellulales bacterium]
MSKPDEGILIAVEGIDGAGKTTQVELLRQALVAVGEVVIASKEPTNGPWGRKIRESAQQGRMSADEELHAFIEDRKEHVAQLVQPALERGEIVILDRYYFSTIAYQGSRGMDVPELRQRMESLFPRPDVVLLFDARPEITLERIESLRGEVPNHFERLDLLTAIRRVFLDLAAHDETILRVDAEQVVPAVFRKVIGLLVDSVLRTKRAERGYRAESFAETMRVAEAR